MIASFISVVAQVFAWLPWYCVLAADFVIAAAAVFTILKLVRLIMEAIPFV